MPERPTKLYFVGEIDPSTGQPVEYWGTVAETGEAVPARDLDADDLARLSDETVKIITGKRGGDRPPLYQKSEPASRRAESADDKPAARAAAAPARKAPAKKPATTRTATPPAEPEPAPAPEPEPEPAPEPFAGSPWEAGGGDRFGGDGN